VRVEDLEEQLHGWLAAIQLPSGFREQFARAIADGQLTKKAPARSIGEKGALVSATPRAGWLPYLEAHSRDLHRDPLRARPRVLATLGAGGGWDRYRATEAQHAPGVAYPRGVTG